MTIATWKSLKNLSIKVYDGKTGTSLLTNNTSVYVNNTHTAIIEISFIPLDADGNEIVNAYLPDATSVYSHTSLIDFETGSQLAAGGQGRDDWQIRESPDVFACPLGLGAQDPSLIQNLTTLEGSTYTLKYFLCSNREDDAAITSVNPISIGMLIDLEEIGLGEGQKIESKSGSDYNEYCSIQPIHEDTLPFDIMNVCVVPDSKDISDDVPVSVNSVLTEDNLRRAIHYAYYFDLSDITNKNFQHNNNIFTASILGKSPTYNPKQVNLTDPTVEDPHDNYADSDALEACCFLDRRDGFYNYKAYLWPLCLSEQKNFNYNTNQPLENSSKDGATYHLYSNGFTPSIVQPSKIFTDPLPVTRESLPFDFENDTCIYISVYLTFGYMNQYFSRGVIYKLYIYDQYGNTMEIETNPGSCPSIFDPARRNDNNGLSLFFDYENKPIPWLSLCGNDTDKTGRYTSGNWDNLYFWLISGDFNTKQYMKYSYDTDSSSVLDSIGFINTTGYTNLKLGNNDELAYQSYRLLDTDSKTIIDKLQYKFALIPKNIYSDNVHDDQTTALGIRPDGINYSLYPAPIINTAGTTSNCFHYMLWPVWSRGTFLMWGSESSGYSRATTSLSRRTTKGFGSPGLYYIGQPNRSGLDEFATQPAWQISDGTVVTGNALTSVFDAGTDGPTDPFVVSSPDKGRGDWASVSLIGIRWATGSNLSGTSLYRNGNNQAVLQIFFNVLHMHNGPGGKDQFCSSQPARSYIENSIDIIDYETGQSIRDLKEGWDYSFENTTYSKCPPNGSFGVTNTFSNPDSGRNYNRMINVFITNDSSKPISITRKFGVKFVITDQNWGSPIIIKYYDGANQINIPLECAVIDPPEIDIQDFDISLTYTGDRNGNTQNDGKLIFKDQTGEDEKICKVDKDNCNRFWDLEISLSKNINPIIGWKRILNEGEDSSSYDQPGLHLIGRQSCGLYHNEFLLQPFGNFINNDIKKGKCIYQNPNNSYTPVNRLNFSCATDRYSDEIVGIAIKIVASFLGESVVGLDFPNQNFQFVDEYGNTYDFHLRLNIMLMLYTKDDSESMNGKLNDLIGLNINKLPEIKTTFSPAVSYYSTKNRDYTVIVTTWNSSKETYIATSGGWNYQSATQLVNIGKTFDMSTGAKNFEDYTFNLWLYRTQNNFDPDKQCMAIGSNYTHCTPKHDSYDYLEANGGFVGIDSHWEHYIHPYWKQGKVALSVYDIKTDAKKHTNRFLSIVNDDNLRVYFTGYADSWYEEDSIFTVDFEK